MMMRPNTLTQPVTQTNFHEENLKWKKRREVANVRVLEQFFHMNGNKKKKTKGRGDSY